MTRKQKRVTEHDVGYDCLDGGWRGFQAVCWTCDWRGPEHLRGDEPMGTDESRAHKLAAKADMMRHRRETASTDQSSERCPHCGLTVALAPSDTPQEPKRLQHQGSLTEQLDELMKLAVRDGLYDAHDWLRARVHHFDPASPPSVKPRRWTEAHDELTAMVRKLNGASDSERAIATFAQWFEKWRVEVQEIVSGEVTDEEAKE